MKILFFDTETTGKAKLKADPEADFQPRIVQLAALLCNEAGKEICSLNLLIAPAIPIEAEAAGIHGITNEFAAANGVKLWPALNLFCSLVELADLVVAHNIDFDAFIVRGEAKRTELKLKPVEKFCTMKSMTDICCLPGPYGNKWPKLIEAYQHCFKKDFEGAHDALGDVRACKEIYFWLQERNAMPEDAKVPVP